MTRPYTRVCHQTNFSEGGLVNEVPFLFTFFFISFSFSYLLSLLFLTFSSLFPFSSRSMASCGGGGQSCYTGEMCSQF